VVKTTYSDEIDDRVTIPAHLHKSDVAGDEIVTLM